MVTVMRRRKTKRGGVSVRQCVGEGVKVEGQGGELSNKTKKRKQNKKNYRRPLPSRSGLVKTFYVNRGVVGSKQFLQSTNHTLLKVMQE